ncbi:MAG: lipopolysaccharide biosynthesis protein [Pseudomonadota bacterium]
MSSTSASSPPADNALKKQAAPSRWLERLLPVKFHQKLTAKPVVAKAMVQADSLWQGGDDNSQSLRTAALAFSVRIASAFIAYVSQVLIARWIGTYDYGIFVWVWTMAIIMGGLVSMGFPSSITRFIPEYQANDRGGALRGVVFGSRLYPVLMASLVAGSTIATLLLVPSLADNIYAMPLILAAACLPMLSLGEVQDGLSRGFNWMGLALVPTYLIRPAVILSAMGMALWAGAPATASTALIATITATWVTSLTQMLIINRRLKKAVPRVPRQFQSRHWLAISLPILLVDGFFNLLTNVDILIAGLYVPPQQVAIYFAAVKTLALVHFVYFAVKAAVAHRYRRIFEEGDPLKLRRYVQDSVRWTFWPSMAVGAALLLVGEHLIALFGEDFTAAYPLLFILIIGIIARAAVGPSETLLNMVGYQKSCAAVYGVTLLVNILLNLTLIPTYGITGAAWATTMALIFEAVALYAMVLRRMGFHMVIFAPQAPLNPVKQEQDHGSV